MIANVRLSPFTRQEILWSWVEDTRHRAPERYDLRGFLIRQFWDGSEASATRSKRWWAAVKADPVRLLLFKARQRERYAERAVEDPEARAAFLVRKLAYAKERWRNRPPPTPGACEICGKPLPLLTKGGRYRVHPGDCARRRRLENQRRSRARRRGGA